MNKNKFALDNIISLENVKDSYLYQKPKEALKNFFWCQFETEGGYNDENDEEMYCYVLLSYAEYDYLDGLCRLVNIDIENYSPMKYHLPNNDIRGITYSYCLCNLPDRYFNYADFKKLRHRVIKELINGKLIQFNLDRKTFWVTPENYFKIICQLCVFTKSYILRKTQAINKLENLFLKKSFYKINDIVKEKTSTDKLKKFLWRLSKLKFLSDLRKTADIVNKGNAKNDLKILFKRNVFHKIHIAIFDEFSNKKKFENKDNELTKSKRNRSRSISVDRNKLDNSKNKEGENIQNINNLKKITNSNTNQNINNTDENIEKENDAIKLDENVTAAKNFKNFLEEDKQSTINEKQIESETAKSATLNLTTSTTNKKTTLEIIKNKIEDNTNDFRPIEAIEKEKNNLNNTNTANLNPNKTDRNEQIKDETATIANNNNQTKESWLKIGFGSFLIFLGIAMLLSLSLSQGIVIPFLINLLPISTFTAKITLAVVGSILAVRGIILFVSGIRNIYKNKNGSGSKNLTSFKINTEKKRLNDMKKIEQFMKYQRNLTENGNISRGSEA